MFPDLRLEVMDRFTSLEQYFRKSGRYRGQLSQTARGLVFVQIYAIHEYTIVNALKLAIETIASHSHSYSDLRPSLLAMFLNPELCSLRDCGLANVWERRIALLDRAVSRDTVQLSNPPMPNDGSHFRHTQIKLVLKVLGVTRAPTARRRHLYRIDEVVDTRNSIAHGEQTAAEVGRAYSNGDIWTSIRQMKNACLRLVMIVEEHCNEPANHCR